LIYSRFDTLSTFKKQYEKIFNLHYGSAFDRIELWKKTCHIIKEKPVFGGGMASWKINILKQGNKNLRSADLVTFYQRPHNDYLWIASETGIIGLFIYLTFIIFLYIRLFKNLASKIPAINIWINRLLYIFFLQFSKRKG